MPTRPTRGSPSAWPGWSTTAAWSPAAMSRTPRTAWACVPSAAWSATWSAAAAGMVGARVRGGGGRLVAVACVGGDGQPLMPCGRCRQLLWEHGGAEMLIETVSLGIVPMRQVLPDAFGPDDLVAAAARP